MDEDNLTRQIDEVEALTSIYGDEWCVVDEASRVYCINISQGESSSALQICLQVTLPPDYPSSSPPFYQLQAPWLRGDDKYALKNILEEIFCENIGESIIYLWVEKIREFLQNFIDRQGTTTVQVSRGQGRVKNISEETDHDYDGDGFNPDEVEVTEDVEEEADIKQEEKVECPEIHHTDLVIRDRRSVFTSHLAKLTHRKQVELVINKLLEDKRIASATHNIYAYRLQLHEPRQVILQGCDDDGEIHAGSRMLHLMQIIDAMDVMVVVTRWYGGVHLGPDRFKHINNCLRSILDDHGFIKQKVERKGGKSGRKGKSKDGH